jgi:deferrochelatase/peroxidase EfeB
MMQHSPTLTRRHWLLGSAVVGLVATLGLTGIRHKWSSPSTIAAAAEDKIPFLGMHQAGITTPMPAAALVVALDTTAKTLGELKQLFQILTQRIQFLMAGGTPEPRDPKYPPNDSGILGPTFEPDDLTVTVAVGASLFDQRFGLTDLKPKELTTMPNFPNDRLDPSLCHGDLLLQFCANHDETTIHALRDILKHLSGLVVLRWQLAGFQQPDADPHPKRTSVRNLMGFKDGTANPNPADRKLMDQLVWVSEGNNEPAWAVGGSYQVVRVIRMFVEFWDRTPLDEQEQIIGRQKDSGAPLGMRKEEDSPNYTRDPKGLTIPLDAHIRLANPRTSETDANRILRNGFHYSRGIDQAGQLDMGLLFICFQQDLQRGFATVQNRLNGEPLEEYIKPIGGGYFFVLPGVQSADTYLGSALFAAA